MKSLLSLTNVLQIAKHLKINSITIVIWLFLCCCSICGQTLKVESENFETKSLILQNISGQPVVITKVGAKVSNILVEGAVCLAPSFFGMSETRPLQLDANYSIAINVKEGKEKEVVQEAEPLVIIKPKGLKRIFISVLPYVDFLIACYDRWQFDVYVFVIYKNTADGTEHRLNARYPMTYTDRLYRSFAFSEPLPPQELKDALTHANPTIRAYALRQFIDSNTNRDVVEGILRNKLEKDPSEEVRVAAAYVAARLGFKELGVAVLSQLKITQDANAVKIYCWALATLQCTDAVESLFKTLFNLTLSTSSNRFEDYPWKYKYTPDQALIKLELSKDVSAKAREYFLKYRNWSRKNATNDQSERFSKLCWIMLKYKDANSIPMLLEVVREAQFLPLDNPQREVWNDFIISESESTPNSLINDDFMLGLRPAFEIIFNLKGEKPAERYLDRRYYSGLTARYAAFSILCRMPLKKRQLEDLLLRGFQDKDVAVRVEAARIASILNLEEFIPQIVFLLKWLEAEGDERPKSTLCEYLKKLGASYVCR
jgi:hypothetical protein